MPNYTEIIVQTIKHLPGRHNQDLHSGKKGRGSHTRGQHAGYMGRGSIVEAGALSAPEMLMARPRLVEADSDIGRKIAASNAGIEAALPGVKIRSNAQFYKTPDNQVGGSAYPLGSTPKVMIGQNDAEPELSQHALIHETLHIAERNPKSPLSGVGGANAKMLASALAGKEITQVENVRNFISDVASLNLPFVLHPGAKTHMKHVEEPVNEALTQLAFKRMAGSNSPFMAYPAQMNMLGDSLKEAGLTSPAEIEKTLKAVHYDAGAGDVTGRDKQVRDTLTVKSRALNKAVTNIINKKGTQAMIKLIRDKDQSSITDLVETIMTPKGSEDLYMSQPSVQAGTGVTFLDSNILKAITGYSDAYFMGSLLNYAGYKDIASAILESDLDMTVEEHQQLYLEITDCAVPQETI